MGGEQFERKKGRAMERRLKKPGLGAEMNERGRAAADCERESE